MVITHCRWCLILNSLQNLKMFGQYRFFYTKANKLLRSRKPYSKQDLSRSYTSSHVCAVAMPMVERLTACSPRGWATSSRLASSGIWHLRQCRRYLSLIVWRTHFPLGLKLGRWLACCEDKSRSRVMVARLTDPMLESVPEDWVQLRIH